MDISMRFFLVGIFGIIFGMIGAFLMIDMIDKSNDYISKESEHPPDEKEEKEKGGESDGHTR